MEISAPLNKNRQVARAVHDFRKQYQVDGLWVLRDAMIAHSYKISMTRQFATLTEQEIDKSFAH